LPTHSIASILFFLLRYHISFCFSANTLLPLLILRYAILFSLRFILPLCYISFWFLCSALFYPAFSLFRHHSFFAFCPASISFLILALCYFLSSPATIVSFFLRHPILFYLLHHTFLLPFLSQRRLFSILFPFCTPYAISILFYFAFLCRYISASAP
jgi:hypothetical protein